MLGVKRTVDFIRNIKARLNLPDEKINAIAKDVNEKIFLQVREAMKRAQNTSTSDESKVEDVSKPQSEIHHPKLDQNPHLGALPPIAPDLVTPPPSKTIVDKAEESEEIKSQIEKQQVVHHTAPPPPNLPTAEPVAPAQAQDPDIKLQPSDGREEALELGKPDIEKKKPYSQDPYREPFE